MGPPVAADILRRAPTPAPPRVSRRQTRLPGRVEKSGARAGARCADRPPPSRGGLSPSHGLARGIAPWPCGSKAIASAAICSCPQSRKPLDAHDRFRGGRSMTPPRSVCAPVAQLDRAPDYESGGREFESLRARHRIRRSTLSGPAESLPAQLFSAEPRQGAPDSHAEGTDYQYIRSRGSQWTSNGTERRNKPTGRSTVSTFERQRMCSWTHM